MADVYSGEPQYDSAHVRGYYPAAACYVQQQAITSDVVAMNITENAPRIENVEHFNKRILLKNRGGGMNCGGVLNYNNNDALARNSCFTLGWLPNRKFIFTPIRGNTDKRYEYDYHDDSLVTMRLKNGIAVNTYNDITTEDTVMTDGMTINRLVVNVLRQGDVSYNLFMNYVKWAAACYAWQPLQDGSGNNALIELTQNMIYEL